MSVCVVLRNFFKKKKQKDSEVKEEKKETISGMYEWRARDDERQAGSS